MNVKMLQNYEEWLKRTPGEILEAVKKVGGWKTVFSGDLPLWAHRVRNFFNLEPMTLTRLSEGDSGPLLKGIDIQMKKNLDGSMKEEVMKFFTLSGDVYRDNYNRIWYQMGPGAAIYHYGSDPMVPELEAPLVQIKGQNYTPVFKLISPDGTGGSRETIIRNPMTIRFHWWGVEPLPRGESNIGEEDVSVYVSGYIIQDTWKQGSYNYSETVEVGNSAHEKHDVKPHKKHKFQGVYINPSFRHALLPARKFPPLDEKGKALAAQL